MASKKHFFLLFLFSFLICQSAHAERPADQNFYTAIGSTGQIAAFDQQGAAFLSLSLLSALRNGQVSPLFQFVLVNKLFNDGAQNALKYIPSQSDPYLLAKAKFNYGFCLVVNAYKSAWLISLISSLSNNSANGGFADAGVQQANQQMAMVLLSAFSRDTSCTNNSADPKIDPAVCYALTGNACPT